MQFKELTAKINFTDVKDRNIGQAKIGQGAILKGGDLLSLLDFKGISREGMIDKGLRSVRRALDDGHIYFISNPRDTAFEGWAPLAVADQSAVLFDPMMKIKGQARFRKKDDGSEVYLKLDPYGSCILETFSRRVRAKAFPYFKPSGESRSITGEWTVDFIKGGPELPQEVKTDQLGSWTNLNEEGVKQFSGTARYSINFKKPEGKPDGLMLDLGEVHESARVVLNGHEVGTLLGPVYKIVLPDSLLQDENKLEVNVSNLMANRIADMDKKGLFWKKFYNVDFPPRLRENRNELGLFDASNWQPMDSGLMGPVTLTSVKMDKE